MTNGKGTLLFCLCALLTLGLYQRLGAAEVSGTVRPAERVVVIDPGHGGEDGGAVAVSGTYESQINLEIALRTEGYCALLGVPTVLLRTEDVSLADESAQTLREKKRTDLQRRAALVTEIPGARLLSIHQNFFESAGPHGAQVFYHGDEESVLWAETLQDSLRENLDPENTRTAVPVPEFVYLMRHVDCPAVLVECGFLSNPAEDANLESPAYQKKLSALLAASCLEQGASNQDTNDDSLRRNPK